jgi:predicted  nucleic acid-binding Zn-ribbon protein
MVSDELGMQLHDRDTLGEPLTAQEQTQLAEWYATQDAAEAAMFAATQTTLPNLAALETQVDRAISELAMSAQRLQQITVENKSLREEISRLKQQLATPRSA